MHRRADVLHRPYLPAVYLTISVTVFRVSTKRARVLSKLGGPVMHRYKKFADSVSLLFREFPECTVGAEVE